MPNTRFGSLLAALALTVAVCVAALTGCKQEVIESPVVQDAPPVYTGPAYLRGSIGSLAKVQGFNELLVSGYGLVVNLDNTGSICVPTYLRQKMLNYARLMGLGSANLDTNTPQMSPENVLANPRTALVKVSGLIPPGASVGQRFDLLVEALPQTETTSLVGGTLWTTELGIEGASPSVPFTRTLSSARGPIYTDPFANDKPQEEKLTLQRKAVVVGGGITTEPRRLRLVLNQPSWFRSGAIASRINERFPAPPNATVKTANAQTDTYIDITVPPQFRRDPEQFLRLVGALYLQGGEGFEVRQTQRLAQVLADNPKAVEDVTTAWKAMGRVILPELRKLYTDPNRRVQLAALDAGAWLGDGKVTDFLKPLAESSDPVMRTQAAEILAQVPNDRDADRILAGLLDDPNRQVRLQAYQSLSGSLSPAIEHFEISDPFGVKFIIDRVVTARRPLIYITQDRLPRIVIFGPDIKFPDPTLARIWDNHLMIRYPADNEAMKVFYQPPGLGSPRIQDVQPSVATLAYLLGHKPTDSDPQPGFGLTYGQVVDAIYQIQQQGFIVSPIEIRPNALARMIDERQQDKTVERRAEFGGMQGLPDDVPDHPLTPAESQDTLPAPVNQPDVEPEGRRDF